jgi:outer membrane protein OmpA-like peptidoglycan-associated protein
MPAEASEKPAPATDPYASAKANIRDTVKWLIAALAGVGAAVMGSSPLTGLGSLEWGGRLLLAASGGFTGMACVLGCISIAMELLRSEAFFITDLGGTDPRNAELRCLVDAHAHDILLSNTNSIKEFLAYRQDVIKDLQAKPSDADAQARWKALQAESPRITSHIHFLLLTLRLRHASRKLLLCACGAVIALGTFAWASNPPKSAAADQATLPVSDFCCRTDPGHDYGSGTACTVSAPADCCTLCATISALPCDAVEAAYSRRCLQQFTERFLLEAIGKVPKGANAADAVKDLQTQLRRKLLTLDPEHPLDIPTLEHIVASFGDAANALLKGATSAEQSLLNLVTDGGKKFFDSFMTKMGDKTADALAGWLFATKSNGTLTERAAKQSQQWTILFDTARADMTPGAYVKIGEVRAFAQAHPQARFIVRSHTDTVGPDSLNAGLASRRARAVVLALSITAGLGDARIMTQSLAKVALPVLTEDQVSEPDNRSVEISAEGL